jgi:5-(carboxyamino)imidazole ribonucleotide mutase
MTRTPRVAVLMGSDSDLRVMSRAAEALDEFGVGFEITVVSAHRTPERLYEYARGAERRGLRVLIAGAGGAAHLPGMVAALSVLPVIGVPIEATPLGGLDALLSIVQMPAGVPVATVAVNNARNAGLLAVQILGASDERLRGKLQRSRSEVERAVLRKAARVEKKSPSARRRRPGDTEASAVP